MNDLQLQDIYEAISAQTEIMKKILSKLNDIDYQAATAVDMLISIDSRTGK